jgi:Pyruvate/2-oxoacid:ferredoxin oxidoreductase delta subunit
MERYLMISGRMRRYPRDYTEEELREQAASIERAVTIPVNVEVEAEHRVLDLSEVERLLRNAENIVLQDCGCRADKRNCGSPLDTCISLDVEEDYVEKYSQHHPRFVTVEEALDALRRSHEAGLVHMAYVLKGSDKVSPICSCCPCCCHTLGGLIRFGISTQVLKSKLVAEDDDSRCVDCGKCAERCVFGARTMINREKSFDARRCFGCGLCVSSCPAHAIRLTERSRTEPSS